MKEPTYIILYVSDMPVSMAFYTNILGKAPVESSPGFSLFVLESGWKLGLWTKQEVKPAADMTGGGAEIGLMLDSQEAVDTALDYMSAMQAKVIQAPTQMDFGYTFVVLDPDEHRIRVFCPSEIVR
ncbi:Lactoylglutathione lyase [Hahella chejuensis KCTC 2396]|uniref:Lactoylglutathione lyase n=1 Tax=Hahella chejuensis (strain KCTC 2396) TaxID=349521 RepID=Q2SKG9_HAHCH|nr:VOC family protein [Hahella chejuensis]ABC28855.1 Lactoylglutathione lyase [Hahella chejuensis KCTC 2396]